MSEEYDEVSIPFDTVYKTLQEIINVTVETIRENLEEEDADEVINQLSTRYGKVLGE
jgi:hypothetical protein